MPFLLQLLLFSSLLLAGPPPGWHAGVEGQQGSGSAVWSADGTWLAVGGWDGTGLRVVAPFTGKLQVASTHRGSGFHPAWAGSTVLFKEVTQGEGDGARLDQILAFDALDGRTSIVVEGLLLGDPSVLGPAPADPDAGYRLFWTTPSRLHEAALLADSKLGPENSFAIPGFVDLAEPDPSGSEVAFVDASGRLDLLDLASGYSRMLTEPGAYSHPAWSDDGRLLLVQADAATWCIFDPGTGAAVADHVPGGHPRFLAGSHTVVFERLKTEPFRVVASDLFVLDPEHGRVSRVAETPAHERAPSPSPDNRWMAFSDSFSGDLLLVSSEKPKVSGTLLGARDWSILLPGAARPEHPPSSPVARTIVDVPYMHQLWDTPDDFAGGWSCGPTSCMQVIQRWKILPDYPTTCSEPVPHECPWALYVPDAYTFDEATYDIWGLAEGDVEVQGAHGFICRELGSAIWDEMVDWCVRHGVDSEWSGTSFSTLAGEIDAGWPMYASTLVLGFGHVIVLRGYGEDHSVVVNDPYGDAGSGEWGNDDGEGVVYDWPGYNNGNLEISVNQLFTAHRPEPLSGSDWDAEIATISAPTSMSGGEASGAIVAFRNTGQASWQPGATFLGTRKPLDRESSFAADSWIGPSRPATVPLAVAPGETGRFALTLVAPRVDTQLGYVECFGLEKEGGGDFGPDACFTVVVSEGKQRRLPKDASISDDSKQRRRGGGDRASACGSCSQEGKGALARKATAFLLALGLLTTRRSRSCA
jgi:hypothetical protein